ncbi:MAG: zinc-dependent alcohol dehydrogenase family protein [Spirochaetaceae bacterium]|jgi:2-desacetyl-2-hydroxyethyl bacteriochlorophyllide A dehydrogenase|nr:zinc-dependent alcohol dehydrogenase family protein [Spirochaetaceae bacterium]
MKALVIEKPGTAQVREVPIPPLGEEEVRIKVKVSGICGTDLHIYRGIYLGTYPIIPGHEFSGLVEETGSQVTRLKVGDRVAVEPNISCDNCPVCLSNRQNFCENWSAVGVTRPGGLAEYVIVPEKAALRIPDLPFLSGAFVEPLSCVLHGIERSRIRLGDKALILGAGPIGLLLLKVIRLQGAAEVTQVDRNQSRRNKAKQKGAAKVWESLEDLDRDAFDVVIDASGSTYLMERTLDFVRKGGTVLWFGVPARSAKVNLPAFTIFEKGLTLLSSFTSVRNSIQAVKLLETGAVDVKDLVSHQLSLEEFTKGVELLETGAEGVLKVVILPEKESPGGPGGVKPPAGGDFSG